MPLTIKGLMYVTPTMANLSVDMAGSGPYMWTNCEERGKNVS